MCGVLYMCICVYMVGCLCNNLLLYICIRVCILVYIYIYMYIYGLYMDYIWTIYTYRIYIIISTTVLP